MFEIEIIHQEKENRNTGQQIKIALIFKLQEMLGKEGGNDWIYTMGIPPY